MSHNLSCAALVTLVLASQWISPSAQPIQQPGTWMEVTPNAAAKSGYTGIESIQVDPVRKSDCWFGAATQGIWKSTNYGLTWNKVNTGTLADQLNSGRCVYFAIDLNPNRDPATNPTLYCTQLYGAGGIFKSTDGGVNWTNIWNNNIFSEDGATNISTDVGQDLTGVMVADSSGPNHLLAFLHSYYGNGGNNGVFESTDGGGKWIVHKSSTFNFQPHSDRLFVIPSRQSSIWCVVGGGSWPNSNVYRSTNSGASWETAAGTMTTSAGRSTLVLGQTVYAGSAITGLFRSTNNGASWNAAISEWAGWVVATATRIYTFSGASYDAAMISSSPINSGIVWTKIPGTTSPQPATGEPENAMVTFDGSNYIILAAQQSAGIWRYVEPAVTSSIAPVNKLVASSKTGNSISRVLPVFGTAASLRNAGNTGSVIHDLQGRRMSGALKSCLNIVIRK